MADPTGTHYYDNNRAEHLVLSNAIHHGARDIISAVGSAGYAGIKETSDAARDNIRETSRVGSDVANDVFNASRLSSQLHSDSRSAIERTSGESRLQTSNDTRSILLGQRDFAYQILDKVNDNSLLVSQEACKTREKSAEQFSVLQMQHGEIKLQMCKDHAELAAQIAKCCCEAEQSAAQTRALILATDTKRVEADNANLRQELLLARINGNGNGNN